MSDRERKGAHGHRGKHSDAGASIEGQLADPRARAAVIRRVQAHRQRLAEEREKDKEQEKSAPQQPEQQAPQKAATKQPDERSNEYAPADVELCKSPTEFAGGAGPVQKAAAKAGFTHWWIRTPDMERGMGPRGGGVPGVPGAGGSAIMTSVNDHTGRHKSPVAECHPASEVGWGDPRWEREDKACLQAELALGKETGPWVPPVNDCHEVVKEALDECRIDNDLPSGGVPAEPHDMGEPTDGGAPQ